MSRDSDGRPEGLETPKSGSTEGNSAGLVEASPTPPLFEGGEVGALIERLRASFQSIGCEERELVNPDGPEAADALERLTRELADAEKSLEDMCASAEEQYQRAEKAEAALAATPDPTGSIDQEVGRPASGQPATHERSLASRLRPSDECQAQEEACDHCCCCGPGEPCCDCGEVMPSRACIGETCWCGAPASKKVGEEILFDDPMPQRHNLTRYVCARHYAQLMGPLGAEQVGLESDSGIEARQGGDKALGSIHESPGDAAISGGNRPTTKTGASIIKDEAQ